MESENQILKLLKILLLKIKYGIIHKRVKAGFGCTSRGQARRLKAIYLFEQRESELKLLVLLQPGISEGVVVRPGTIIEV